MSKLVRVRAKARGFIQNRIMEIGQEFDVPEGIKGSWFEPVASEARPRKPKPEAPAAADKADPDAEDLV